MSNIFPSIYESAERLPERFDPSVWSGENKRDNLTAVRARQVAKVLDALGPRFSVGEIAAAPDALPGAAAPALPIALLEQGGYSNTELRYVIAFMGEMPNGHRETILVAGHVADVLDGPENNLTSRVMSLVNTLKSQGVIFDNVSDGDLRQMIEPFNVAVEIASSQLLADFIR